MEASISIGALMFLFGIVSAKWALDLGYSQIIQISLFAAGAILGPLVVLALYIRFIYRLKMEGLPGGQIYGNKDRSLIGEK